MKENKYKEVIEIYSRYRIIPVIAIENPEYACDLADALVKGGLPVMEITFRTSVACDVIRIIREKKPDIIVGAGTVLSVEDLKKAFNAGAVFAVSPGLNPDIVAESIRIGFPFFPGVMTPSEIEKALSFGIKVVKYFPAEAAGGIKMIKSISAPYLHLGVKFIPTGGITEKNLLDYISDSCVIAVGGTWIARKEAISERRWDEIIENCRNALRIVNSLKTG